MDPFTVKEISTASHGVSEVPSFKEGINLPERPSLKDNGDLPSLSHDIPVFTRDIGNDLPTNGDIEEQSDMEDPIQSLSGITAENMNDSSDIEEVSDYPSSYEERQKYTPAEGERGHWEGDRGESKFKPTNPEIQDTLSKYEMDGIEYQDGIPDFSNCAEATVEIDTMTNNRNCGPESNFAQADQKCADQWNLEKKDGRTDWTARDVANWRRENGYTWHECNDMKTCQLVPTEINDYFGHLGGVGEYNKITAAKEVAFDE